MELGALRLATATLLADTQISALAEKQSIASVALDAASRLTAVAMVDGAAVVLANPCRTYTRQREVVLFSRAAGQTVFPRRASTTGQSIFERTPCV